MKIKNDHWTNLGEFNRLRVQLRKLNKNGERRLHQMWYDDPVSSLLKHRVAVIARNRCGSFSWDRPDYTPNATGVAQEQTKSMWAALAEFKRRGPTPVAMTGGVRAHCLGQNGSRLTSDVRIG